MATPAQAPYGDGGGAAPTVERAEADSRFGYLVELSRDAFVELDGDSTVTCWNPEAARLFGWSGSEVLGRRAVDFLVPARFADVFLQQLRAAAATPGVVSASRGRQLRLVHRDGHELDVAGCVYAVGDGAALRVGGFLRDLAEERAAEEALAHAYLHDSLTGLPNRTLFTYRLAYALAEGQGAAGRVAVLVLDLDRFKAINDALGHEVGDELLVAVAGRLVASDGVAEVIARLGGDEFLILFAGDDAEGQAVAYAARALQALAAPFAVGDSEVFVTASIGIACTSAGVTEATSLLSNADAAMYQAKRHGGGTTEVFGEAMRVRLLDRMTTEHSLHRALERCELRLFYQPVVDIAGEQPIAVEALLRWDHPEQGLVGPNRFIPVAEESGLIIPIGAWVLQEACQQLKSWQTRAGAPSRSVEVNLSARQIDHPDIVGTVEQILADSGLDPSHLTLEITESALMNDAAAALQVLRALKDLGVTLAIDDFGTGYSSLSYLQRFPLDILKVDKTFVDELGVDADGSEIVSAVIKLAHTLGLQVIAEGVETEAQLAELQRLGCDFAQGYLFSRPVPATELVAAYGSGPAGAVGLGLA